MRTVTISPNFRVTIPRRVRDALGLRAGQKARVFPHKGRIQVIPVRGSGTPRGFLKGIDTSLIRDPDRV
jgi:AbrB family looped-hinge helix DNA binding protein